MNNDRDRWDWLVIKFADIPWGYLIFLILVVVGALEIDKSFTFDEYIKALATGAGLLGLGHGVHTAAKVRAGEGRKVAPKTTAEASSKTGNPADGG